MKRGPEREENPDLCVGQQYHPALITIRIIITVITTTTLKLVHVLRAYYAVAIKHLKYSMPCYMLRHRCPIVVALLFSPFCEKTESYRD